jgi:hypothetical protein
MNTTEKNLDVESLQTAERVPLTAYQKWMVDRNNRDMDKVARHLWNDLQEQNPSAFDTMKQLCDEGNYEILDVKLVAGKLIVKRLEDIIAEKEAQAAHAT